MVDYSRWDHIEVSDDEDDTHPNIDTPSLFRWRHQARVERMDETKKKRSTLESQLIQKRGELESLREQLKNTGLDGDPQLKEKFKKTEEEMKALKNEDEDLTKSENKEPKNVDTLSHEGFTKTIISKTEPKQEEPVTQEEQEKKSQEFMDKYESEIKHFGMLYDYGDSRDYLLKHPHLTCDDTANYLALWCINLQVQEKESLMERVAHQSIIVQYILELAKQLHTDPKATVPSFFTKIVRAKSEFPEYMEAFSDELVSFKKRVRERAEARIEKAMKEAEEEERQARLGPGGLDPVEVFETLPKELQDCFEKKDIPMLQEILGKMPEEEAREWLKKCVDSGLWIANAEDTKKKEEAAEEETYEEVKEPSS